MITSTNNKVSWTGNNNGPYALNFNFTNNTQIKCLIREANGNETQLNYNNGDYSISGNNVVTAENYNNNQTVVLYRQVEITQETDFINNDGLNADTLEATLDKLTMIAQQLNEQYARNIFIPISDEAATMELPTKADRASKFLGFDSDGEPIASSGGPSAAATDFVLTLLDDANAAAFLATLGINATGPEINKVADVSANVKSLSEAGYTVLDDDGYLYILVATGSSDRTIALPTAADNNKRVLHIIKTDPAQAGAIIIDGEGAETVNGDPSIKVRKSATVICNGTGWTTLNDDGVPVGAFISHAGNTEDTPPAGFLFCDGSAVSRTTYARLFAKIATNWGEGDGSTTFNLPDLRGYFIRGKDDGAGIDPDAGTRTAIATGGSTGDAVGSKQEAAVNNLSYNTALSASSFGDSTLPTDGNYSTARRTGDTGASQVAFKMKWTGSETRGVNVAVNFFIKY